MYTAAPAAVDKPLATGLLKHHTLHHRQMLQMLPCNIRTPNLLHLLMCHKDGTTTHSSLPTSPPAAAGTAAAAGIAAGTAAAAATAAAG